MKTMSKKTSRNRPVARETKVAELNRELTAARKQAQATRSAAESAKFEFKRARKEYRHAKKAAKADRKKVKALKRTLQAAKLATAGARKAVQVPAKPVAKLPQAAEAIPVRSKPSRSRRAKPVVVAATKSSGGEAVGSTDLIAPNPPLVAPAGKEPDSANSTLRAGHDSALQDSGPASGKPVG